MMSEWSQHQDIKINQDKRVFKCSYIMIVLIVIVQERRHGNCGVNETASVLCDYKLHVSDTFYILMWILYIYFIFHEKNDISNSTIL